MPLLLSACGFCACGRAGFDVSASDPLTPAADGAVDAKPARSDSADIQIDAQDLKRPTKTFLGMGNDFSCMTQQGALHCWGRNDMAQLGTGGISPLVLSPLQIGDIVEWDIAVGATHACALRSDQSLWCWGASQTGALGLGSITTAKPSAIDESWQAIAVGDLHSCAVSILGELWCWGDNTEGQLAQLQGGQRTTPARVGSESDWTDVAVGQGHTCGLRGDTLWCWGRNTLGHLAQGDGAVQQSRDPLEVSSGWLQVDVSPNHGCGIHNDKSLWCWGLGESGQLGLGGNEVVVTVPTQVGTQMDWIDISTSQFHSCGIRHGGSLWCWGRSIEGQHGEVNPVGRTTPFEVGRTQSWQQVEVGRFNTCALDSKDKIWSTGENVSGQLGIGNTVRPYDFTEIDL